MARALPLARVRVLGPAVFTIQGIMRDNGTLTGTGFSVTNAVELRISP